MSYNNIEKDRSEGKGDGLRLWESLCGGEKKALDDLFRLYYTPLYDYGIKIISNENIVKDAIQELFLKLWKTHSSLNTTPRSVRAYLLVSLRRILFRSLNRKQKCDERNRKYLDNAFRNNFTQEDLMIRSETDEKKKKILLKAINRLNKRQKETLFLRYYHGLTNEEIADVLCINRQSVKNNLYRALKNLRGIITSVPDSV
ncbi:RNA polymerase sigma-70 factor, ECF subfamily [Fodinibius roseus]|uniref:RNA polymerase sigma-70 factor, ECF subfamily n=1 Tax=Fodinibius roseus TaxID=1194090 RepID=A0A1M4TMY1_9BACT|nr:sigma-70 family RNA polymerase sigma factor [Fodinibius roseus]SHE45821.1 RNA polymerase sigma-70 factor, ECF subfamily [Fodinibius roseus]